MLLPKIRPYKELKIKKQKHEDFKKKIKEIEIK